MNLGIVIAVSNYDGLGNNLPGCQLDGSAIAQILKTEKKFDDVLIVTENTHSGSVKPELINFINRHKENDIEDIVFYFTGHGDFSGDEFYFLLSDYDTKKKKRTSLENTELDNLLKTLNPKNAIKIVDACHSGTPYIKDPDAFDTYLKSTKGEFNNCYFMFSSQTDQYSYQDNHLSFFTKSIVESVCNHTSNTVRYKDIIDYVSDSFADNTSQTPFFIVQADFTEPFCTLSDTLKNQLNKILTKPAKNENAENKEVKSILDLVKDDAQKYCSEKEAMEYTKSFLSSFKDTSLDDRIIELYKTEYTEESDYSCIPSASSIGKWLASNEHNFFAKKYEENVTVHRRVHKDPSKRGLIASKIAIFGMMYNDDDYTTIKKRELRITGFRSTVDMPVTLIKITAEPLFPNINPAVAYIVPILSKTKLAVFYSFNFYEQKGWNERTISDSVKWITSQFELTNQEMSEKLTQKILDEFSIFLYNPIAEKFDLLENNEQAGEVTDEKENSNSE